MKRGLLWLAYALGAVAAFVIADFSVRAVLSCVWHACMSPGAWWQGLSTEAEQGSWFEAWGTWFAGLGTVVVTAVAVWLPRRDAERRERERLAIEEANRRASFEALAMTLTPILSYLRSKLPSTEKLLRRWVDQSGLWETDVQQLREPLLADLGTFVEKFDLLPERLKYDALQLAAWGRLYGFLLNDCWHVEPAASATGNGTYLRRVGDLKGPAELLKQIVPLVDNLLVVVEPIHDQRART
jgi:hypothetical protein